MHTSYMYTHMSICVEIANTDICKHTYTHMITCTIQVYTHIRVSVCVSQAQLPLLLMYLFEFGQDPHFL